MTERDLSPDERDLHAYVDGQIEPSRRAALEACLAAHPDAMARVVGYREQNALLRAGFDTVLREEIPARLLAPRRATGSALWRHAAAAALYLAIGAGGGYFWAPREPWQFVASSQGWVERAAVAHAVYAPEVRHPVEVLAAEEAHLTAWLSKRLGAQVQAPRLAEAGFDLVGGRLLPGARNPAAQFMYEDAQGRRLTLYLRTDDGKQSKSAFQWLRNNGVEVCFWIDGGIGYALAGEIDRKELEAVAHLIYRQINA